MNRERVLKLAEHIERTRYRRPSEGEAVMRHWMADAAMKELDDEKGGVAFNMEGYLMNGRRCGTVACMAGHALHLFGKRGERYPDWTIQQAAEKLLDLKRGQGADLFMLPFGVDAKTLTRIKPGEAAAVLRAVERGKEPGDAWRALLGRSAWKQKAID